MKLLILSRLVFSALLARRASSWLRIAWVPLGVAIGGLAFCAVVLSMFAGIEHEACRRGFLALLMLLASLCCLVSQVLLRIPVVLLVELSPLLTLPFGLRRLFWHRFALSVGGLWIFAFGPAAIWITSVHSARMGNLGWAVAGIAIFVLIAGRAATILSWMVNRSSMGVRGSLLLLTLFAAGYAGVHLAFALALGEAGPAGLGVGVLDAALVVLEAYTPFGWLAAILAASEPQGHMARLGMMLLTLAALLQLEWKVLLRGCRAGNQKRSTAASTLPLTRVARRLRRLTPEAVLWLVETECLLRFRPARLCVLSCFAFGLVHALRLPVLGLPFAVLMLCLLMEGVRSLPPSCCLWRESLALPLPVVQVVRTPNRCSDGLAGVLLAAGTSIMVISSRDIGWLIQGVSFGLALSIVLFASGCLGLVQAYWPPRQVEWDRPQLDGRAAVATLAALAPAVAVAATTLGLYVASGRDGIGSTATVAIGAGCLAAALVTWHLTRKQQVRVLSRRGSGYLLRAPLEHGRGRSRGSPGMDASRRELRGWPRGE